MTDRPKRGNSTQTANPFGPVGYHVGRFPPGNIDWTRLVPLIGPASTALARYDAVLGVVPNASLLLAPLTTQEAVLSSRIEGTQATMGEVLAYEAGGNVSDVGPEKIADIEEVLNYRRALREAIELLDDDDDDWTGWCEFFLQRLTEQAAKNESKATRMLELYRAKSQWIIDATNSSHAIRALDFYFAQPAFSASHFVEHSKIPKPTARRILNVCAENGMISMLRVASGRRAAVYCFSELLEITEE